MVNNTCLLFITAYFIVYKLTEMWKVKTVDFVNKYVFASLFEIESLIIIIWW